MPSSSSSAFSLPLPSSAPTFSSLAPSAPLPLFTLPSVVPSVLSLSSSSLAPSFPLQLPPHPFYATAAPLPLFSAPLRPPPGYSAPRSLPQAPLSSAPLVSAPVSSVSSAPLLSSCGFPPVSSSSWSSSMVGDLADFQARVLGLSAEYQALGPWFVASRGSDFRSYLASHCPHLYSDFHADFASGSSRFLAALSSSALLPPLPSSIAPSVSSVSLLSQAPVAPVTFSSSLAPSAPPLHFPAPSLPSLSSSAPSSLPPVSSSALSLPSWQAVPGGSGVAPGLGAVPVSLPVPPPVSAPSLFRPFAADPAPSVLVPAAPLPSAFPSAPAPVDYQGPSSSAPPPFHVAPSFVAPEDAAPDTLPRDAGSAVPAAVPESVGSEFRCMLSFLVDLFPQAVGAPPPPRALFEDFFGSSAPPPPIFLSWFESIRTALSDADARLASFLSLGRADFSFLPPRNFVCRQG